MTCSTILHSGSKVLQGKNDFTESLFYIFIIVFKPV